MVDLTLLGLQLDSVILSIFSDLDGFMMIQYNWRNKQQQKNKVIWVDKKIDKSVAKTTASLTQLRALALLQNSWVHLWD